MSLTHIRYQSQCMYHHVVIVDRRSYEGEGKGARQKTTFKYGPTLCKWMWLHHKPSKTATSRLAGACFTLVHSSSSRNVWITPAIRRWDLPSQDWIKGSIFQGITNNQNTAYLLLILVLNFCPDIDNGASQGVDHLTTWKANRWNVPTCTEVLSKLQGHRYSAAWGLHVWYPWSHSNENVRSSITSRGWNSTK